MAGVHRIAVLAGDGIGREVVPEGLRVLDAAARRFDIRLQLDHFDFASCDYFERHGAMMPANWRDLIGGHDAIFFGPVGWPARVPDHMSLGASLIKFRREIDQYVNLRPARLRPGVASPRAGRRRSARYSGRAMRVPPVSVRWGGWAARARVRPGGPGRVAARRERIRAIREPDPLARAHAPVGEGARARVRHCGRGARQPD